MRAGALARLAPALAGLALVAACGGGSDALHLTNTSLDVTGGHGSVGELTVTRAYIPAPASPSLAAAYFTVSNNGDTADRLETVQTSTFASATLHHYETAGNGLERMVLLRAGAVVPAHGRLALAPGSYHLMLRHPTEHLRQGAVEHLTLRFSHAGAITLLVPVVGAAGLPGSDAGLDQMPGMSMGAATTAERGAPATDAMSRMTANLALPRLTPSGFFSSWSFHPWSALVAAILLVGYLARVRRARRRAARWSPVAVVAWCSGIGLLVFATQGSLRVYDDALFWVHMVGHLTLVMIVPVLLLAGRPLNLIAAGMPETAAARFHAALRGRLASVVTNPGVTLAIYTAAIVGTHLTGFMNQMMLHPWVTGVEQTMYVVAGLLFFLPLVGDAPIRWQLSAPLRMAMLVVAMPVDTFTGVILGQTEKYPWPAMAAMHPSWAPDLVTDLHAGGAVMWIGGDAIMAVMFGIAAATWAKLAMNSSGSELGGWLESARANYQQELVGGDAATAESAVADPDSDAALDAYNAHLRRLSSRQR